MRKAEGRKLEFHFNTNKTLSTTNVSLPIKFNVVDAKKKLN